MCFDYEPSDFRVDAWVKARKWHRCFACRETIRGGDMHHVVSQKSDGEIGRYRHCARCWAIIEALWAAGAESVAWDLDCGETWEENFDDLPEHVAALAFETPDEAQARLARIPL